MLKKMKNIKINNNFIFHILAFALTAFSLVVFLFFPIFEITINKANIKFNGIFILFKNGFLLKSQQAVFFLKFSLFLKLAIIFNVLFSFAGFLFLIAKKHTLSALSRFLCFLSFLTSIFSITIFRRNILKSGFSKNNVSIEVLWPYIGIVFLETLAAVLIILKTKKENLAKYIFFFCTIISLAIIVLIVSYFIFAGMPVFFEVGILKFVFGKIWNPTNNEFGILNFILASFFASFGAILIATPLGVFFATFLSEFANKKLVSFVKPIVEILAGIPSVIYGFFGMTFVVPYVRQIFDDVNNFEKPAVVGDSLLSVIIVLTIMILPTIISTSFVSLKSVPISFKEASLNLGATKTQTTFKVVLKAAKPGIFSGLILAVSKAIGETMAVMMVAGNVVNSPKLLNPVRLLTSGIAIDIAYSSGLFRKALFGMSFVLFVLINIVNISLHKILNKGLNMH